jgi:hypothetical protein
VVCPSQLASERTLNMMLVGGYFDESTDEFSERVYTVAGYLVPGWQGSIFELRWKALLDKWNFRAFKASHLEYGFGDFVQYRDDPNDITAPLSDREKSLIRTIKTEFVDLICEEDAMWGYAAALNLRHYSLLEIQEPELAARLPKPYHLCGQLVMMGASLDLITSNKESPAWARANMRPVFDSHEDYEFHMLKSFRSFCEKNPNASKVMLEPIYETDETYLCLQAADCLAFESRKFIDGATSDNPPAKVRIAFNRLMEHVRTAFYLDYDTLKSLAERQPYRDMLTTSPTIDNRNKRRLPRRRH